MKKFTRREVLKTGLAGVSALSTGFLITGSGCKTEPKIDQVNLGQTGLQVSRLAFGCGNSSSAQQSKFTRLGQDRFLEVAQYAYERGITFLDTADLYGTHPFVRELFKIIPRENFQLMTKIWTTDNEWHTVVPVQETIDRFKKELNTDHFDIVLLHCMMDGNWITEKENYRDKLSEMKQKGQIKQLGVSCHNIDALKVAATDPWVDIILARINPNQLYMDGTPEEIIKILETASENGKGVIGMKIFGNGEMTTDDDRIKSLSYSIKHPAIHSITIGMEEKGYVDYAVDNILKMV